MEVAAVVVELFFNNFQEAKIPKNLGAQNYPYLGSSKLYRVQYFLPLCVPSSDTVPILSRQRKLFF